MKNPAYGHEYHDGEGNKYNFTVDLITMKIVFDYEINNGEIGFNCDLFSEIGEPYQHIFKDMLEEDHIVLGILDTPDDYCNIVVSGLNPEDKNEWNKV